MAGKQIICAVQHLLEHDNVFGEGKGSIFVFHSMPPVLDHYRPVRVRLYEGKGIRQYPCDQGVLL